MKNVVLIMADSLQFNYLGCYGNDWIKTPNIDGLARESVLFENAYAEGVPTIPVRRALMTGRYTLPSKGWGPLNPDDTTLADILYNHHTQTALITDCPMMHLPKYGYERGFDFNIYLRGQEADHFYANDPVLHLNADDFHKPIYERTKGGKKKKQETNLSLLCRKELNLYMGQRQYWKSDKDQFVAMTCKNAMNYLENVARAKPFFLWVDTFDPHEPWDPPSIYDRDLKCPYDPEYRGKDIILPVAGEVKDMYTERELHHIRKLYAEKITMVDKWIGKLLDRIRELGLYENTLIIFLSDHGEPLGNREHGHGIMRKIRPWPYEELVHIPLIIRHPDGIANRNPSYVQTPDLAPTTLDFMGAKDDRAEKMQGKSLLPLIAGEDVEWRDFAIAGYHNFSWSIITKDWSYVHWLHEGEYVEDMEKMIGFYDEATRQIVPELYDEALKLTKEDNIWSCTPGAVAETPDIDELYDRKKDPFQLKNVIKEKPRVANRLFKQLRDFMISLRMS